MTDRLTCCVPGCESRSSTDYTVYFHRFPKADCDYIDVTNKFGVPEKVCQREVWRRRLMMNNREIMDNMRVCSLHFKKSDHTLPDAVINKEDLAEKNSPISNFQGAVKLKTYQGGTSKMKKKPDQINYQTSTSNIFLNNSDLTSSLAGEAPQLGEIAIKQELLDTVIKTEPLDTEMFETCLFDDWEATLETEQNHFDELAIKTEPEDSEIKFEFVDLQETHQFPKILKDNDTQTTDYLQEPKYTYIIRSEEQLKVLTGIPSFDVLNKMVEILTTVSPRLAAAKGLKFTVADRVVMTLMKLKQAMNYGTLSFFFKCSRKSCRRIVLKTLDGLSSGLRFAIRWLPEDTSLPNIAQSSRHHSDVRCIVNRIEIEIRRPKILARRIATRLRYKKYHSVKFLTAVTPGNWICFLSKAYGGRTSHKDLFEQSEIIKLLRRNDRLMILKDFPIDDICQRNGINLVKSLLKQHREEMSNPQYYRNMLNVNRKLRGFMIFRRKLSPSLSLRTEQILTVLCALQNLRLILP